MGLEPGDPREVDHVDFDRLNNRRSNLRVLNKPAHRQHVSSRRTSTSKYRGVSLNRKTGKWLAQVYTKRKNHNFGSFDSEEQAAAAALKGRQLLLPFAID